MEKVLKDSRLLIIILFVFLTLPFNVEAKGYNWTILEWNIDKAEFISGDDVSLDNVYIPVDAQEFEVYNETHLQAIRELVAEGCSFDSCYFELKNDIILSGAWKPIGQIKGYDSSLDLNDQEGKQYTYTAKGKNLFPRAEKQVPEKGEPRNSEIRRIIEGFSNGNLTHFYKKIRCPCEK